MAITTNPEAPGTDFGRPKVPSKDDIRKFFDLKGLPDLDTIPAKLPTTPTPAVKASGPRTGYVLHYSLELHEPSSREPFFRVTIVDDAPSLLVQPVKPEEFVLIRNILNTIDMVGERYLTVSYGNVEQAIVATIKDALVHGKRIAVDFDEMSAYEFGVVGNRIKGVSLLR